MRLLKLAFLSAIIGVLAGTASALFLVALAWATDFRVAHPDIIVALPFAGFAIGWMYHRFGRAAAGGNTLIIAQIHSNNAPIPARMTPMILVGTVVTHLFGGSAGREGTAIQMGASLADTLRRLLERIGLTIAPDERRWLLLAGMSGGFASVFGTPAAGFVFALEVPRVGRIDTDGIAPCLIAACVGDVVTRAWGVGHAHYPALPVTPIDAGLLINVVLVGAACGLVARAFVALTDAIRHQLRTRIPYPPLRPLIGGVIVLLMVALAGTRDYLGLSLPLLQASVSGVDVPPLAFAGKLAFTAVTLGSGFVGGEVTPLFVMGSTLGHALGGIVGVDPAFMAALALVAVFAGASKTPLACAIMGVELFGGGAAIYSMVICVAAYLAAGRRGIYASQRIELRQDD
ncbi:MAG: chloride channel protein [Chloroflexota bacterium]|nr:chloride channel protein [Chloroflexota bacterium]